MFSNSSGIPILWMTPEVIPTVDHTPKVFYFFKGMREQQANALAYGIEELTRLPDLTGLTGSKRITRVQSQVTWDPQPWYMSQTMALQLLFAVAVPIKPFLYFFLFVPLLSRLAFFVYSGGHNVTNEKDDKAIHGGGFNMSDNGFDWMNE
ncbi:hypothetical protein B0H19DRAFT_1056983 [Mycena capillaripes]|nr:hypothetical protein B0H19DRAFT_1056983 [Mycena capillaripes]